MSRYKIYNQHIYITNNAPTKTLFDQREKLEKFYPKGFGFPEPIDFWDEKNRMYGLMDQNKNLITPRTTFIRQLKGTTNGNLFAFDFVCDAFNGMQHYMNGKNSQKLIDDAGRIKKPLVAHKAWQDPLSIRKSMDDAIYDGFVKQYLKFKNRHKEITNEEDFIEVFFNICMIDLLADLPLTTAGMLLSNSTTPMSSGLCIEISSEDSSNVYKSFDTYYNNINYKTYLMTAAKFGFIVDKNAPNRLVANLSSPKMLNFLNSRMEDFLSIPRSGETNYSNKSFVVKSGDQPPGGHNHQYVIDKYGNGETDVYSDQYGALHKHKVVNFIVDDSQGWSVDANGNPLGIGYHNHSENIKGESFPKSQNPVVLNLDIFYDLYYNQNIFSDISSLISKIKQFYNRYVQDFPSTSYSVACGPVRSRKITISRVPISTMSEFSKLGYDQLFFIKLYFIVRLKELQADVTDESIKANLKKIDTIYNLVDKSQALRYIDIYLKQFY